MTGAANRAQEAPALTPAPEAILSRAASENFPVALRLLSRAQREHLLSIYGFARLADEIGDASRGDRLAQLELLEEELDLAFRGCPRHPILVRLRPSIDGLHLPRNAFERLIEANRRDQSVHRYETWQDLLGYCALSANPVGELVLHVFGAATAPHIALSNEICSALQLAEHWQDVAEDRAAGRIYLPAEDLLRFGCTEEDLAAPSAKPALRALMRFEVGRTWRCFERGAPLLRTLRGRARVAVAAFLAGGRAALDAISLAEFDVLRAFPTPRRRDFARHWCSALLARTPRMYARHGDAAISQGSG